MLLSKTQMLTSKLGWVTIEETPIKESREPSLCPRLLYFSALSPSERQVEPSPAGWGSFLRGHGCSSQTKHWLIALLFVGSVPVFVLSFSFVWHSQAYYLRLCLKDGEDRESGSLKNGPQKGEMGGERGQELKNMNAAVARWMLGFGREGGPDFLGLLN